MTKKTLKISVMLSISVVLLFLLILTIVSSSNTSTDNKQILVWGFNNTDLSRNSTGLNALRLGNSGSVEGFKRDYDANKTEIDKYNSVYVAFGQNRTFIEERALKYSNLSSNLSYSKIIEIGIDDFLSWWENDSMGGLNQTLLNNIINNTKAINQNLSFGITLYEDHLNRTNIVNLPQEIRNRIDVVHLYLHFRRNGPSYETYVNQTKLLFPNAKIIAGSYAYDRIDFIRCYQNPSVINKNCTEGEELMLFIESIRIQNQMLNDNQIQGIEFYPGYFGYESTMAWGTDYKCNDIPRCIRVTEMMRHIAALYLNPNSIIF
jgi:hypothetical protein